MNNFNKKNKTKGGSPIIYRTVVDHGSGPGGKGPFAKENEIPFASVKTKSGTIYNVPIDKKTGKVPEYALYQRFANVTEGTRDGHTRNINVDLGKLAGTIHIQPPGGFTPEQLIDTEWWQYPGESDILGIDDPSSDAMSVFIGATKGSQSATERIAIIAPPDERERIMKVLTDNFTGTELKRAVKNGGMIITIGNAGAGAAGFYRGKQPSSRTPTIVLEPGSSEDTITHEFVHHLRQEDDSRYGIATTPYPLTDDRSLSGDWFLLTPEEKGTITNMEEAATVLEAATRTRDPEEHPTGYYAYIPDGKGHTKLNYDLDRNLMTLGMNGKNAPQRGSRATKRVNSRFEDSKISDLHYKKGKSAKNGVKELKAKGKLTTAPAKPKTKTKVPTSTTAPIPATAKVSKAKSVSKSKPKAAAKTTAKKKAKK